MLEGIVVGFIIGATIGLSASLFSLTRGGKNFVDVANELLIDADSSLRLKYRGPFVRSEILRKVYIDGQYQWLTEDEYKYK